MKKTTMRNFLVRSLAPFSSLLYSEKPAIRVLALHDIPASDMDAFAKKMRWLKQYANVVSLRAAYERKNLDNSRLNVVITFDDGYKSQALAAAVLRDFVLPATFFVPSMAIGLFGKKAEAFSFHNLKRSSTFEFMSKDDVVLLSKDSLFEIGGHTKNHVNLGVKLTRETLLSEIKDDKTAIEKIIGKPIDFLAYPFGSVKNVCDDSARTIREAGYKASFTILPDFWRRRDDVFRVGRDSLSLDESDKLWAAWLSGGYDLVSRLKHFLLKLR